MCENWSFYERAAKHAPLVQASSWQGLRRRSCRGAGTFCEICSILAKRKLVHGYLRSISGNFIAIVARSSLGPLPFYFTWKQRTSNIKHTKRWNICIIARGVSFIFAWINLIWCEFSWLLRSQWIAPVLLCVWWTFMFMLTKTALPLFCNSRHICPQDHIWAKM